MTTPPGYVGNQTDTEGVSGNAGAAPRGTQDRAANTETATPAGYGGDPDTGLAPQPGTSTSSTFDTTGTNSSNGAPWTPTSTLLSGTVDTQSVGWPTTAGVTQAYRAPTQGLGYINATGAADTTWTDQPISNGTIRPDLNQNMTGTLESVQIGNNGAAGGPTSALVPVAPAGTPTVVTGARQVTVTWTAVADPAATAPVLGYVILGSTGGTTFVGDNQLSAVVTNLDPGQTYQFRVAARNKNGVGPYGNLSAAVRPYNPDVPDVLKPGGLDPYWAQNAIYNPNGTFKAGSGLAGIPLAPTGVTVAGAGAQKLNVTWVAPSDAQDVRSYTVTLSTGQTKTGLSPSLLTTQFTGLTTGVATTARVTAVGPLGSNQSAVSNSVNVP
jgi:hypothetical protein